MELRAAKKHLKKGILTPQSRIAACRFLRHLKNNGKIYVIRVYAKYLYDMFSIKNLDIKDAYLPGIVNLSHEKWNLTKLENFQTRDLNPTTTRAYKISIKRPIIPS